MQGIVRHLLFNETIERVVSGPRLHHQLMPTYLSYEAAFDGRLIDELRDQYGYQPSLSTPRGGYGSLVAIGRDADGRLTASFDERRGGSAEVW